MGNVIILKDAVLDYKPGSCNPKIRLHALEVYNFLERLDCGAIVQVKHLNNITFCDFAIVKNIQINQELIDNSGIKGYN